jgi:hypothetical protein
LQYFLQLHFMRLLLLLDGQATTLMRSDIAQL